MQGLQLLCRTASTKACCNCLNNIAGLRQCQKGIGRAPIWLTSMKPNWTQEDLDRDLKLGSIAERELNDATQKNPITEVMENIEGLRKERRKTSPGFTQKHLAENAGISLATYKNYLSGLSDGIRFKTVLNMMHILQCSYGDIVKPPIKGAGRLHCRGCPPALPCL